MRNRRGFTLIELLVVIAIIGILATLVITQLAGAQVRARNSNAKSDVTQIGKAIGVELANNDKMGDKYFAANAVNPTLAAAGSNCTAGTCLDGTVVSGFWTAYFNTSATGYNKLSISKTPSASYVYAYGTDVLAAAAEENDGAPAPTAAYYCIATNVSTASAVSDTAFFINNGASGNSTGIAPTFASGVCN